MDLKQKRALAKNLYLNTDLSNKAIAESVDVTEKTLAGWIKKYGWEDEKAAESITPDQLLRDTYAQLKALNDQIRENGGVPSKKESDAKAVLIKEIEALARYPLHRYIAVMDDFVVWMGKNQPKKLKDTASLMNEFIESLAIKEGAGV